jgi:hypothetical protein
VGVERNDERHFNQIIFSSLEMNVVGAATPTAE